jgi:membrane protein YdbS with pleckstrin-like domain
MPLSILFWVIYVIAILFGTWSSYEAGQPLWVKRAGGYAILWILVGILGWRVFGHIIQG